MSKPNFLEIQVEDDRLFGIDEKGNKWWIRWCGNGAYSHWVLTPEINQSVMYYVYNSKPYHKDELLVKQIEEAERKYNIYS